VHVVATRPGWEDRDRGRLSYRHVVGNAEAALRRLDTDWIDLYQLHAPDFTTPWEETLRALDDLVSRGLVRYLGWSNHPAWHAARGQGIAQQPGTRRSSQPRSITHWSQGCRAVRCCPTARPPGSAP
jgi:aryl-alcohol dehydrogenase-like predicted oxidoreductase